MCITIRRWIDAGLRPVPLSINVTKTDILAMDIADTFDDLLKKYRLPPRSLEIEIAQNAYLQSSNTTLDTEERLRQDGFKGVVDGFDGDYIKLSTVYTLHADALKLDLRRFNGNTSQSALNAVFDQARKLQMNISVEGIENMEQLALLRKCGCTEGQGFFMSKPVTIEEFEAMMNEDKG